MELTKAVARKFHAGQMYGKHDYMYHLEAVEVSLARENDDRLPKIGILHDILEDTDCTEEILKALFDDDIVRAVCALTKGYVAGETYAEYIVRVKSNPLARVVKMHDTMCNLEESLVRRDTKRILKYSKQLQLLAE